MLICKKCKKPSINEICDDCKRRCDGVAQAACVSLKSRKPQTFIVFQGKTFYTQLWHQIIWAPKCNEKGESFHYWDRIKELQEGDKIFHVNAGKLELISVVKEAPTREATPFPLDINGNQEIPNLVGYFAKINTVRYHNPLFMYLYRNEIVDYKEKYNPIYFPFNKHGGGCQGYLYHLPQELADLFESEIKRINYKK